MSKTRNQRRRSKWFYRIVLALLLAVVLAGWVLAVSLWIQVEQITREQPERTSGQPVLYLPEGWDEQAPEWVAAQQRYNAEEGLLLPQLTTEEGE